MKTVFKIFFLVILLFIGAFFYTEYQITFKNLQKEISELKTEVSRLKQTVNSNRSRLSTFNSKIRESNLDRNLEKCNFDNAKYLIDEIGYLNFDLTKENRITYEGELKGKRTKGYARITGYTLFIKENGLVLELNLAEGCRRIKGFLTLQRKDETWEIFDLEMIKV